jgi:hypothetical protein
LVFFCVPSAVADNPAINIGSRRELLVDDCLIDHLAGRVHLKLHHPIPRDIALVHDQPWEGSGSGYHSVFQDGETYRMYYKAWHLDVQDGKLNTSRHPLFCCYAESDDGIQWRKPQLGLHTFQGNSQNNIVIASGAIGELSVDAGHPAVFKDLNPKAAEDAKYKAILRSAGTNGLIPFKSPDGIHWTPLHDQPILSGKGAFDSQNLAFWDPILGKYRAYWRIFTAGITTTETWQPAGHRDIRTATSDDLIEWGDIQNLKYDDNPPEHLYTNQIKPYYRAPHILIGFPTRYVERGWSESMRELPETQHRQLRAAAHQRYGTALTEGLLMASRDGVNFKRWREAFLRPGVQRPGTWNYGQQYIAWHVVETRSNLPGAPNELSLYATESYWTKPGSALRRYTLRLDGFVSLHGTADGGSLTTRPVTFSGNQLHLNFATSAAGNLRVELQLPTGEPLPGFGLNDCDPLFGDSVDRTVSWQGQTDVSPLQGKSVRIKFFVQDGDLYSFQFVSL